MALKASRTFIQTLEKEGKKAHGTKLTELAEVAHTLGPLLAASKAAGSVILRTPQSPRGRTPIGGARRGYYTTDYRLLAGHEAWSVVEAPKGRVLRPNGSFQDFKYAVQFPTNDGVFVLDDGRLPAIDYGNPTDDSFYVMELRGRDTGKPLLLGQDNLRRALPPTLQESGLGNADIERGLARLVCRHGLQDYYLH